ncbi:MAG: hypothetical protein Q4A78_02045 [Peptostreptococcaceae bacterium]|nr:hypothetical protein [Peptostreptococcaceae bacterium]
MEDYNTETRKPLKDADPSLYSENCPNFLLKLIIPRARNTDPASRKITAAPKQSTSTPDNRRDRNIETEVTSIKKPITLPIIFSSEATANSDINKREATVLKKAAAPQRRTDLIYLRISLKRNNLPS